MTLTEQWKQLEAADTDLAEVLQPGFAKHISKDPMLTIQRNLWYHSLMGIAIIVFYLFLLWEFPVWQVILCIGVVLLFTLWAVVKALLLRRQLLRIAASHLQHSLLQQMRYHQMAMGGWMKVQQKAGLVMYPLGAAGGFMIGGSLGAGKSIDTILQNPTLQLIMLLVVLLLVPPCFYLAKWMCRKSFGQYLQQLNSNIAALSADENSITPK
ncbi:MAG TPA: hypothetical protein VL307_09570 [Chitinophagaceae bacterium]|nr:hypothetical protein [Chitinophagaceae bacterium]